MSTLPDERADARSGTSMVTPRVAGVVARYVSSRALSPTPESVADWPISVASPYALGLCRPDHDQWPNLLLFVDCSI